MRWPGEWETHERTLMGWPCRIELWDETLAQAQRDYAEVANAIGQFEPVTMIANFYVWNGGGIVPVAGGDTDDPALALIAEAFPGREVVAVPGNVLAYGGGGPHCITQQVPTRYE